MTVLDIQGDAQKAFAAIQKGSVCIIPNDTGYGLVSGTTEALRKLNTTKGRGGHKRNALLCDMTTQRTLHRLEPRTQEMVEAITQDYELPLGCVAPYDPGHPLLAKVDDELRRTSTADNTLGVLLNAGAFYEALTRLSREAMHPIFGSSANLTGSGPKFRVSDIEPEIRAVSDLTLDYGLRRYHTFQRSATIIDFRTVKVIRFGIHYEMIAEVLKRHFQIDLPKDPGLQALPSGHIDEFALERLG